MLSIQGIVKKYADHVALDHVSLEVPKGKIYGLLGPNVAGKTSLIRIINQITAPDEGRIFFNEEPLSPKHIAKIGYLPEERGLYKKMKIGEQMIYLAQLKGLSRSEAIQKIKYWFEKLHMETWWEKKVEDLSKGMQQKVQFVATIVHNPELIILDEPFSGFDPVNTQIIQDEILELNKNGATIIYSTHRMESVEELCDHIALINKSQKILEGEVNAIKQQYRKQQYQIYYQSDQEAQNWPSTDLFSLLNTETLASNTKLLTVQSHSASLNDILAFFIPWVQIQEVKEIIPSMRDIFIEHVTPTSKQPISNE